MSDRVIGGLQPVSFGARLAASQNFSRLFRDGMKLVEDTAAYLDGPGRRESKLLDRAASLAYATESMRLTTRLMQLASWLLLHRAVNEGEMSLAQANKDRMRIKLPAEELPPYPPPQGGEGGGGKPRAGRAGLEALCGRAKKLKDGVGRRAATIHARPPPARASGTPFKFQLGILRGAFEGRPP